MIRYFFSFSENVHIGKNSCFWNQRITFLFRPMRFARRHSDILMIYTATSEENVLDVFTSFYCTPQRNGTIWLHAYGDPLWSLRSNGTVYYAEKGTFEHNAHERFSPFILSLYLRNDCHGRNRTIIIIITTTICTSLPSGLFKYYTLFVALECEPEVYTLHACGARL